MLWFASSFDDMHLQSLAGATQRAYSGADFPFVVRLYFGVMSCYWCVDYRGDGKHLRWGQGKQIFNPIEDNYAVPDGASTKDFEVPASAGQNVKIEPTADE
jgi:hypothetical protein